MLSSVLRSERAVRANIAIMRAFVGLREVLGTHEELRQKIEQMEKRYDAKFHIIFATIKQMLEMPLNQNERSDFILRGESARIGRIRALKPIKLLKAHTLYQVSGYLYP